MTAGLALPGAVSSTGLELPHDLSYDDWAQVGVTLGALGKAYQWWIGDWLQFGEAAYGERYSQAMDATGLEYSTVANVASVAGKIEPSRRREKLSFGHHEAVARCEPAEQDAWLDAAEENEWTRAELRRQMKEPRETPPILCPHCGKQLDPADLRRS